MAVCDFAVWRPLGGRPEPELVDKHKLVFHTMVGTLRGTDQYFRETNGPGYEGTESHLGTDPNEVFQWQDTNFQADAQLEGNDDCVSVETADMGSPYPAWSGVDVPAWTDAHMDLNAKVGVWVCKVHSIPAVRIPDTRHETRGIGSHRDGIDPYREAGERYSRVYAKACPGDRREAQMPELIQEIRMRLEDNGMEWSDRYGWVPGWIRRRWPESFAADGKYPDGYRMGAYIAHSYGRGRQTVEILRDEFPALRGELAGIKNAVQQLGEKLGSPIDLEAVEAASREGTRQALNTLSLAGTFTLSSDEDT